MVFALGRCVKMTLFPVREGGERYAYVCGSSLALHVQHPYAYLPLRSVVEKMANN
jgi:hypothetical protein